MSAIPTKAKQYENGTQEVAYYDTTSGNIGREYRFDDVDVSYSDILTSDFFNINYLDLIALFAPQPPSPSPIPIEAKQYRNVTQGVAYYDTTSGNIGGEYRFDDVDVSYSDILTNDFFNINYLELIALSASQPPSPSPIRIEAEEYRNGALGVAYYDTTPGNSGGEYRFDDVDVSYSGDVGDGYLVGWIEKDEWLTYDITVPTSGIYQVVARTASEINNNHSLKVTVAGNNTTLNFGGTGGWRTWQSVQGSGQLSLSAGTHQLRLDILTNDFFNINYLELVPVSTPQPPSPSPIRIEAEEYRNGAPGVAYYDTTPGNSGGEYRFNDVDVSYSGDVGDGYLVGWIEKDEWLTYDITVPTSGIYQVVARTASEINNNHSLKVTVAGNNTTLNFGGTGGWRTWQSVQGSGQLSLSAGTHQLRLDMLTSGFNINYLELVPVSTPQPPSPSPIRIEAEEYRNGAPGVAYYDTTLGNSGGEYRFDDVDVSYSGDVGGGHLVGWIEKDEWLTYDITVPTSGIYQVVARTASEINDNHSLKVTVAGNNTTLNFGGTGGWRTWQSVQGPGQLSLSAGTHQLRLDMLTSGFNINYLELVPVSNLIYGVTGNNIYNGSNGIDTITYAQARGPIVANLGTGVVNHKFATLPNTPFKIMPLGDSNTFGMIEWDSGAYRDDLWNLLVNDGFNIDFVGPRSTGPDGFDKDNAGFGGWKIRDIASNNDSNGNVDVWLNAYNPDMVLLMIGTNDILKDDDISNAPSRLSNLIDRITSKLPNTQLLVASIPPISTPYLEKKQPGIDFNSSIPGIVSNKIDQGKKVTYVDVYSGLTPSDLQDGVHPSQEGYGKVANVWHEAILNTDIGKDKLSNIENIIGSSYNDILIGNGGVNVINGGGGDDLLIGGNGKDTFVLSTGQGTDNITDFKVDRDLLGLSGGLTFGQLTITQANNGIDTWIINGNEHLASLNGVQASSVTSNVFTIV